jgi:Glycosyl transferase family 2
VRIRSRKQAAPAPLGTPGRRDRPDRPPRIAVITMARDEGQMLRVWVDHYARHVGRENLVVLDDGSTDGSTDDLRCTVHRLPGLPGRAGFELARMALVSGIAQGLLAVYDYVAFVDVDEFLVPDPARYATLPDLVADRWDREVIGAVGLNLVHVPGEPTLDLSRPVLEQRRHAIFTPLMCKPALKRVPAAWAVSSHGIRTPYDVDPSLLLLHLKFADRDRFATMSQRRNDVNAADGRAGKSTWSRPADDLVRVFDEVMSSVDPEAVRELELSPELVADVVSEVDGVFRTPRQGQLQALRQEPVIRLPQRLAGTL